MAVSDTFISMDMYVFKVVYEDVNNCIILWIDRWHPGINVLDIRTYFSYNEVVQIQDNISFRISVNFSVISSWDLNKVNKNVFEVVYVSENKGIFSDTRNSNFFNYDIYNRNVAKSITFFGPVFISKILV